MDHTRLSYYNEFLNTLTRRRIPLERIKEYKRELKSIINETTYFFLKRSKLGFITSKEIMTVLEGIDLGATSVASRTGYCHKGKYDYENSEVDYINFSTIKAEIESRAFEEGYEFLKSRMVRTEPLSIVRPHSVVGKERVFFLSKQDGRNTGQPQLVFRYFMENMIEISEEKYWSKTNRVLIINIPVQLTSR